MPPGKVGVAVPGAEGDVVDEDGKPVPPNVGGRLVRKRPFPCMPRTVWRDPTRYEIREQGIDLGDVSRMED